MQGKEILGNNRQRLTGVDVFGAPSPAASAPVPAVPFSCAAQFPNPPLPAGAELLVEVFELCWADAVALFTAIQAS